ncbi:hypothetical protein BEN71_09710 [Acinetobacter wuhouensis]|uniref:hypothetical protein n=1 Tax=Acinetobacter wuhouensis TaxID=1879050 RepID=UPI00083B8628|nr:hypothetical protein [Acinetobacter wuhouensis]AXQ22332.1 hypothetical protein BEN71_09710 [Acinetobacter wuhouensis]
MNHLSIITQLIIDIWNSQQNVVLSEYYVQDAQHYTIEILIIRSTNMRTNQRKIILCYDEYRDVYGDATDLYIHAIRKEFDQLEDTLSFIFQMKKLDDLYQLFKLNYSRRFRKLIQK